MFQFVGNRMEHCLGASVDHFAEIAAIESTRLEKGRSNLSSFSQFIQSCQK